MFTHVVFSGKPSGLSAANRYVQFRVTLKTADVLRRVSPGEECGGATESCRWVSTRGNSTMTLKTEISQSSRMIQNFLGRPAACPQLNIRVPFLEDQSFLETNPPRSSEQKNEGMILRKIGEISGKKFEKCRTNDRKLRDQATISITHAVMMY
jgi:hypothetical protein